MADTRKIPKLHGWITPEYAVMMIIEMVNWIENVSNEAWIQLMSEICIEKLDGWD